MTTGCVRVMVACTYDIQEATYHGPEGCAEVRYSWVLIFEGRVIEHAKLARLTRSMAVIDARKAARKWADGVRHFARKRAGIV